MKPIVEFPPDTVMETILKGMYANDIAEEELIDEAIATLEKLFAISGTLKNHRDWAIPYLALKYIKRRDEE